MSEYDQNELIVIEAIKSIHDKKKRADIGNISTYIKDLNPKEISKTLTKLCDEEIIFLACRSGLFSYRFYKKEYRKS